MRRLIGWSLLLAGGVYAGWRYWQESTRPNAEAWAAGTDRVD